jgi:glycosidase
MTSAFARERLGRPRPATLFGQGGVALPHRVPYHPSPVDWRDEILYFLLVDRFSDGSEAGRPLLDRSRRADHRPDPWRWDSWARSGSDRWQGGTLRGISSKLDYLTGLGVTTLWLSPVFKQRGHLDTYHGYGVQDFLDVDPRFGTRRDLVELVDNAHDRGMRILLDIIFNHSGSNWRYPANTPGSAGDGDTVSYTTGRYPFGDWNDAQGHRIAQIGGDEDGAWPTELQDPGDYTRAGSGNLGAGDIDDPNAEHKRTDFLDLRDFDLDHPVAGANVLGALAACYKYWISLTDCDGFRIDTLKHVTEEQARNFCGSIKEFTANIGKSNFFLVGEIAGGDFAEDRYLDVLDRNLNAALDIGEMRPALVAVAKGMVTPSAYFDGFDPAKNPFGSHRNLGNEHVSILDDHDEVFGQKLRFSANASSDHQVVAGVAVQLFSLGIPCIYYGTEQAFAGPEASEQRWLPDWGSADRYLREAMFGPTHPRASGRAGLRANATDNALPGFGPFGTAGAQCFDAHHPAYRRIALLCNLRKNFPVLRQGRQYLRPISLFEGPFQASGGGELLGWSRILDDEEALCLVNTHGSDVRGADVVVDASLNTGSGQFSVVVNTAEIAGAPVPHPTGSLLSVQRKPDGTAYLAIRDVPPSEVLVLDNRF